MGLRSPKPMALGHPVPMAQGQPALALPLKGREFGLIGVVAIANDGENRKSAVDNN